jgi:hypothetical protein
MAGMYINAIAIRGNYIFAATYDGVLLSVNNCESWQSLNTGLRSLIVESMAVCGDNVFATTPAGVSRIRIDDITAVETSTAPADFQITLSPNPVSDVITVTSLGSDFTNRSISIYNSLGVELKRYSGMDLSGRRQVSLSTKEFPPAAYYVVMHSGNKISTAGFVIVR